MCLTFPRPILIYTTLPYLSITQLAIKICKRELGQKSKNKSTKTSANSNVKIDVINAIH